MTAAAPGWYHAEGDPPNTVRRWNGAEWIGFPQRHPGSGPTTETIELGPAPGQVRLGVWARLTQIGMVGPLLIFAWRIYASFIGPDLAITTSAGRVVGSAQPAAAGGTSAGAMVIGSVLLMIIGGLSFMIWFFLAYANVGRWARTEHHSVWAVLSWFVPFMNLRRPYRIALELVAYSPREDDQGAINPILVWVWWVLNIATMPMFWSLTIWGIRLAGTGRQMALVSAAVVLLASIVATWIIVLVFIEQVTRHQDARFKRTTIVRPALANF